jgi:3-deoxy-D-manno-octulosonate 8-phosphate phosphatase (KDO 8-P phosphatase)
MWSEKLNEKLKKIKMLVMDVDGTLTNANVFYSKNGEELKEFSIRDGMGCKMLEIYGIESAIITSEISPIVTSRAAKLKISKVIQGSRNKKKDLEELAMSANIELDNIVYVGDDINDYYAIKAAGIGACPNNSVQIIKEISDYICEANGGQGAIRELAEMILIAQNKSINLPESW